MGADDEAGTPPADADVPEEDDEGDDDTAHLDDLPDGSGCAEVWEHVSAERDDDGDEDAGAGGGG